MVTASDPDIITDFVVPENLTKIDGDFFTFTALRGFFDSDHPPNFKVTEAGMADSQNPATAISASGSANAGTVSVPTTVAGNSGMLTFEAVKDVGGLAPTRDRKAVQVNNLPSTFVTFGGTIKSEIISASPDIAIWKQAKIRTDTKTNP
ncbi:hypothetical protein NC652_026831 [Populus alba x Populus x berolinensis]|nr:hypothetical protein NC652_026831 [Populus alba x Populus x berolinensis]